MIKSKRQMYIVIGAFALVLLLGTTTYAFFNYTRTGSSNIIKTGRISFNSEQGTAINLTNLFPIDPEETGIMNDATKVGTVTINVIGDTTYSGGIEYLVSAVNVQNSVGSKQLPISIQVSVEDNNENDPSTSLGTADADYFTNRGTSAQTSIYKVLATDVIKNNDQLVVGYIKSGQDGVDGNIVIKAYIDKEKVAISDTHPEGDVTHIEGEEANQTTITDYTNGTTDNWVDEREVFTTTEWNSLQANGVSFKIKVEANEGIWVLEPIEPICKRVTNIANLHTELCNSTTNYTYSFCYGDGYAIGETITYGNAKSMGSTLATGDAFDCKVSSSGDYTERFYYVSPYYDTNTQSFDNSYAALIYYGNTIDGLVTVPPQTGAWQYDSSGQNWHGPVTAISNLPTTTQWDNIELKSTSRIIFAENGSTHNSLTTNNGNNTIENPFSYSGYAARLLNVQELMNGCGLDEVSTHNVSSGALSNCNFLLERTFYNSGNGSSTVGPWLENPDGNSSNYAYYVNEANRNVMGVYVDGEFGNFHSFRPTIDVPLSRMEY